MSVQLVIAEKPSVARSIAAVIGATEKQNGYWQGGGYLVSWCIGHLVSFAEAGQYDEKYCKWKYEDLPILPQPWQFIVPDEKKQQFEIVRSLLNRPDVDSVTAATDAGREGELIFRFVYHMLTDYENEQNELNKIIETDTADMQRIIGGQNNVERFLKLVKKYENITELTPAMINEFIDKILVHEPQGKGADRTTEVEIYLNYVGQFQVPVEQHEPTEEERIAAEKEAERLRRKRESNRKYMKKIREKSKEFAEHERIAEEKSSDSNVCVEQNATSKSNRQKVKGEKIA